MSAPQTNPMEAARAYLQVWAEAFSTVLSQIGGSTRTFNLQDLEEAAAVSDPEMVFCASLGGGITGSQRFGWARTSGVQMAQLFSGEPATAAGDDGSDPREVLEELLRQIAGQAASVLKARWGETQIQLTAQMPPESQVVLRCRAVETPDGPQALALTFEVDRQLVESLGRQADAATEAAGASVIESRPDTAPPLSAPDMANLGFLLDVPLSVTLCFGRRQMLLRDILELTSGAVVELDRQIQEPVELLVDGRVIARGEAVVVGGNYGLRVLEVATPGQRADVVRGEMA